MSDTVKLPHEWVQSTVGHGEWPHGKIYPEGGVLRGWRVDDMCDNCMKWLRETLEANGVRISNLEVDI